MTAVAKKVVRGLLGIIALNIVVSMAFISWLFIAPTAMGPLIREPAKAAIADGRGPLYLLLIVVGTIAYELICRRVIQTYYPPNGSQSRWKGIAICAVLASLIYGRFGVIPAAFGLLVGGLSAFIYLPNRKWAIMTWQVQWQFGQMAITLLVALLMHGECRGNYLWAYKLRNIREGNLCYRSDWGWVDASHKHLDRFEMMSEALEHGDGESVNVTVSEPFVTISRDWLPVTQSYEVFNPQRLTGAERWAVISGISMDFSRRNEEAQGSVPFYRCSQLSSWQFDDMPSTLLTCLVESPGKEIGAGGLVTDKAELEARWKREGSDLVRRQFREVRLPKLADPNLKKLLDQIELAKEYWRPAY